MECDDKNGMIHTGDIELIVEDRGRVFQKAVVAYEKVERDPLFDKSHILARQQTRRFLGSIKA